MGKKTSLDKATEVRGISRRSMIRTAGMGLAAGALGAEAVSAAKIIELDTQFMAMWIHGTSLQVEFPERMEVISHRSVHTHVAGRPHTENRIHFAIPTPVVGQYFSRDISVSPGMPKLHAGTTTLNYRLEKALLRFNTSEKKAHVFEVNIHDGQKRIAHFAGFRLRGQQLKEFVLKDRPNIRYGVSITALVKFGEPPGWIEFIGAGGDFILKT